MKLKSKIKNFIKRIVKNESYKDDINLTKINQGKLLTKQLENIELKNLNKNEFKVFSQFGEDSIIQFLIKNIQVSNKKFVEIGVENYEEANTRFLLENNLWEGLIIDNSDENVSYIKKQNYFWKNKIQVLKKFVTRENINSILKENGFEGEIGLLSIDIDGNDYWLWQSIEVIKPDILIIEYNAIFGPEEKLTLKYSENFVRPNKGIYKSLYGASLNALCELSKKKGYSLVCGNSNGNNAFFVKNNLLNDKVYEQSVKHCFKENTFKEYLDEKGELNSLKQVEISKILNSDKIIKV